MSSNNSRSSSTRSLLALVCLGLLMLLFISLGRWQLSRAQERQSLAQQIEQGRQQAPLHIDSQASLDKGALWQSVAVHGSWRSELTVLLDNRNFKGKPGYWIATPFVLDEGDLAGSSLLVLRGWLARVPGQTPSVPAAPSGFETISGELMERVPRLFELGSSPLPAHLPDPSGTPPVVQNLALEDLRSRIDLPVLPRVLAQTAPASELQTNWPDPNIDFEKNRGYALQWFGFALIALCAWIGVAWKWLRRSRLNSAPTRKT